jgi:hypothetical protein
LPVSKGFGLKLVQMPKDIQNLGLFSSNDRIVNEVMNVLSISHLKKYSFVSYSFVFQNNLGESDFVKKRVTHYLPLDATYTELFENYEQRHRRNVKDFHSQKITVMESENPEFIIEIRQKMAEHIPLLRLSEAQKIIWRKLITECVARGSGKLYYAVKDGKYLGGTFFLLGKKRHIFVFSSALPEEKEKKLAFGLVDRFIMDHCGENKILDLSGSDIKGISLFLRGFGSIKVFYDQLSINNLPYLLRLVKNYQILEKIKRIFG